MKPSLTCITLNVLLCGVGGLLATAALFPLGRLWSKCFLADIVVRSGVIQVRIGLFLLLKLSDRVEDRAPSVDCLNKDILVVISWKQLDVIWDKIRPLALRQVPFLVQPLNLQLGEVFVGRVSRQYLCYTADQVMLVLYVKATNIANSELLLSVLKLFVGLGRF